MSISFSNYSMRLNATQDVVIYDWCVFVAGDRSTLDHIANVRYKLHPTFPDPIRITDDRYHRFALNTTGWGEFRLSITVTLADGTTEELSYWVQLFNENWPKKQRPPTFSTDEEERVYNVLVEGQYRWRKVNTLARKTALEAIPLRAALERLESADLARRSSGRSIDQQELWGATAIVGIMPRL
jgi:transcription initiation factor IIF auxiliary subunit